MASSVAGSAPPISAAAAGAAAAAAAAAATGAAPSAGAASAASDAGSGAGSAASGEGGAARDVDIAARLLEVDCAFQPQARRLILATKAHSHKQLTQSTYLYARGVLLGAKAERTGFPSLRSEARRREYIRWRHHLLASKWERHLDAVERTEDMSFPSMPTLSTSDTRSRAIYHSRQPSGASHSSKHLDTDASLGEIEGDLAPDAALTDTFKFGPAYHLFTEHTKAVTTVRFANQNRDLLCFASLDGGLTLTSAYAHPTVLRRLREHTRGVTDFDWSSSNEWVLSAGLDGHIRIWDVAQGKSLRCLLDDEALGACRFHPVNNNAIVAGTSKGKLKVYNISTGRCVQKVSVAAGVGALCYEPSGAMLFVGDAKGYVYVFESDMSGQLRQLHKCAASTRPITSIDFNRWQGRVNAPAILVSAADSCVRYFSLREPSGELSLRRQLPISHRQAGVRSQFCPLVSHKARGTCIVTGSEDMAVHILDVASTTRPAVARLTGHNSAVLGVSWAFDESLLASSDSDGIVMLWKREFSDQ